MEINKTTVSNGTSTSTVTHGANSIKMEVTHTKAPFTHDEFLETVKQYVAQWTNEHMDKSDEHRKEVTPEDVYVVWSCKTLQNSKGLFSTPNTDGMYFEATLNGDKNEIYFDAYKKFENKVLTQSK